MSPDSAKCVRCLPLGGQVVTADGSHECGAAPRGGLGHVGSPGGRDRSPRRAQLSPLRRPQIPGRLYGREQDLARLLEALRRDRTGGPRLVLVSGYAGVGKTALIEEAGQRLGVRPEQFLQGKFDQYARGRPYSAFIEAADGLAHLILTRPEEQFAAWRDRLRSSLDTRTSLIASLVPTLRHVIGEPREVGPSEAGDAQRRLQAAWAQLLGAVSHEPEPTVLFLDDLQWAAPPSLELMKHLLTRSALPGLVVLGAYRDNEVDQSHPLSRLQAACRSAGADVERLTVQPLSRTDTGRMLSDSLQSDPAHTAELADLVHARSGGNPLYVQALLQSLDHDGLLAYDTDAGHWDWDRTEMAQVDVTENVADFLSAAMRGLRSEVQETLACASCVGSDFSAGLAAAALGRSEETVAANLAEAAQRGYVSALPVVGADGGAAGVRSTGTAPAPMAIAADPARASTHRFLHDRLRENARSTRTNGLWQTAARRAASVAVSALLLLALLSASSPGAVAAAETTLARLCIWGSPGRMGEIEALYVEDAAPILRRHGFRESVRPGRPTVEAVFSRLLEVESPTAFVAGRGALLEDEEWQALQERLSKLVGPGGGAGPPRAELELYSAPAGPGRTVAPGRGRGHWRSYNERDGLPQGAVRSIIQDREGYLWIAVEGKGVSRFDGQVFEPLTVEDGLIHNGVQCILEDRHGRLWFGTTHGVSRYDGQEWTSYTAEDGLGADNVWSITESRDGALWFCTREAGVSRYDGRAWERLTTEDGLAHNGTPAAVEDVDGHMWIGTHGGGVSRYDGQSWTTYTTEDGLAHNNVLSVLHDREGNHWFGTWTGGVSRYSRGVTRGGHGGSGGTWQSFTMQDGLVDNVVRAIAQDREGYLWFGTGTGASRYEPSAEQGAEGGGWTSFTSADGQPLSMIQSVLEDRDGRLWFGSTEGLFRYDEQEFLSISSGEGLELHGVFGIALDSRQNLWLGTRQGHVVRHDGEGWRAFTVEDGAVLRGVLAIQEDDEGGLWFGSYGSGVTRYDGDTWETFTTADGLAANTVRWIIQGREGHLWFATSGGISRYDPAAGRRDGSQAWRTFTTADGLTDNTALSICQDREGIFWIATPFGLSRYEPSADGAEAGEAWRTFTTADGLVDNSALSVLHDRDGYLWVGTMGGVSRFDRAASGSESDEAWMSLTTADGLAGNWVLKMLQDRAGHLWFGTASGLSRYDGRVVQSLTRRDGLVENLVYGLVEDRVGGLWISSSSAGIVRFVPSEMTPPPVAIRAVVADARYEGDSHLVTTTDVKSTAFEYGAMSFKTRPEAMIYRYRLRGLEEDWQTTHDRRVEYESLPTGECTFEVVAVDRDLVYSAAPATVALTVRYPWGRFLVYATLGLAGFLAVGQSIRVVQRGRRLRETNEALIREAAERERLDAQFQHLNYLHDLRLALGEARTPTDILTCAGEGIVVALTGATAVAVRIAHDGTAWSHGDATSGGLHRYRAPIEREGAERGELEVCSGLALTDTQRRALVQETAAQVSQILEARALEQQLLRSARLISMGEMAAGVAHELNQPLGAISTTVADVGLRLRDGVSLSPEELQEMMQHATAMVARMKESIEQLRVFSRDTSQAPAEAVSVNDAVQASQRLLGTQLKSHGIDLHLDLGEGLPPVVGPPNQLEQVFLNLFSNARDALDEVDGGRDKGIWARTRFDEARDEVVAEVEDSGAGIDAEHEDRVFEPFFTTKDAARGTGLGLSISEAIVRNHGGELTCEAREGIGARFRMRLPVRAHA